jgi:hypothetical protein
MSADLLEQLGAVGTWLDAVTPVSGSEARAGSRSSVELDGDDAVADVAQAGGRRARRWAVGAGIAAAAAIVVGIAVARTGDDGEPPVDVGADSSTSVEAPTTTTIEAPTTTTPSPVAPPGLVVAPSDMGYAPVVVALDDGFVWLDKDPDDGRWTLRTSVDGLTWQDEPTDLPGDFWVHHLRSDGRRLIAVGTVAGSEGPWAETSVDGGRTWSGAELAVPHVPEVEFVRWMPDNTDGAVGSDGYLVVGVMSAAIEFRALTIEQSGRDPGERATYSGGGTHWSAQPDDGSAPITLDLSAFDPAVLDHSAAIPVAWVSDDGASWDLLVEPFGPGRAPHAVASGPQGFLVTTQAARPGVAGEPGAEIWNGLQRSVDGRMWDLAPLPDGIVNLPLIAGDRSGYLLLGEDKVLRNSSDGAAWTRVSQLDMPLRPTGGGGELVVGSAGVVVAGHLDGQPGDLTLSGYAAWSPDGVVWRAVDLPADTAWAAGAVSDQHVLILNAPAG